jgi:electron transfer flavoprotein beta subunit
MQIVVLTKPVPDPTASERLGPDGRVDRSGSNVINGNDEYALEAALKLTEAHGGEVTIVAMSPDSGRDVLRKGLAMGAASGVLVSDPALAGSDWLSTVRVLAAAVRELSFDLLLAGVDTSDGAAGLGPAGLATLLGLPYLSNAAAIEPAGDGAVRVSRITATGFETLEAPTPALIGCTQALGAPRYPTLKGIMGARSKEITVRSLADLGLDAGVGGAAAGTRVLEIRQPPARGETRVVRRPAAEAAREVVDFLATRGLV